MTVKYIVAYPHPSVRPLDRACLCNVGPSTGRSDILEQLYKEYPKSIEDLQLATLWKASDLDKKDVYDKSTRKVYDWINRQDDKAEIPWGDFIVELFPNGPHDDFLDKVDILVATPEIFEAMHMDVGEFEYVRARHETLKEIQRCFAPSECVASASAVQGTLNDPHGPRCGRPSDRFGPPTALFSKPLARLKHELDNLHLLHPDPVTLEHAFALVDISAKFFVNESTRQYALRPILKGLLPGLVKWQESTANKSAKPDGAWFEGIFTYLIAEIKHEQGIGGDPFLQGIVTYGKVIGQKNYVPYLKWSNLPVILLAIAGNRLTVSTAIFTNEIYVDELLSVTLRIGSHGSQNVMRVARVFMAIARCLHSLRQLYKSLSFHSDSRSPPQTTALWPMPTAEPPRPIPELDFFAKVNRTNGAPLLRIDGENERHGMYLARMRIETLTQVETPTETVFVKFAVEYNEDAHRLLAEQDPPLAPALYFGARVIGDMYMVVMEYIPESRGRPIGTFPSSFPLPQNLPELVKRDVSKALSLLHEQDLVFGDLREPNILYTSDSDGGRVLLVDFDAVGRDGVARYPGLLSPTARSDTGAKPGTVMKQEHDYENLQKVLENLHCRFTRR